MRQQQQQTPCRRRVLHHTALLPLARPAAPQHYMDALLDADLEAASMCWQYVAGGLPDAPAFDVALDLDEEATAIDPDGE